MHIIFFKKKSFVKLKKKGKFKLYTINVFVFFFSKLSQTNRTKKIDKTLKLSYNWI